MAKVTRSKSKSTEKSVTTTTPSIPSLLPIQREKLKRIILLLDRIMNLFLNSFPHSSYDWMSDLQAKAQAGDYFINSKMNEEEKNDSDSVNWTQIHDDIQIHLDIMKLEVIYSNIFLINRLIYLGIKDD